MPSFRTRIVAALLVVGLVLSATGCSLFDDGSERVLVVGDSVTYLSAKQLNKQFSWADALDIKAKIGYRTDELLPDAHEGMSHDPDIAVFMPGYNDLLQEVPGTKALATMMDIAAEAPCSVWLLLPGGGGYSPTAATLWNKRVQNLAAEHDNVHVSDAWKALADRSPAFTFVKEADAVHPNAAGQKAIAKVMADVADEECTQPLRSGHPTDEGDEPGLLVGIRVDGHLRAVVAAEAQHLVDRLHAHEHGVHLVGVEGLVEPDGPGEVETHSTRPRAGRSFEFDGETRRGSRHP